MKLKPVPPPRLSVFLAANANRAVILRRGPVRWVEAILWNTEQDTFERGQWFHGRIYEDRCDLSPDGRYFLYFAAKHGVVKDREVGDIWTAVSRPPYFTALALWPQGGTYGGGGYFAGPTQVSLQVCSTGLAEGYSTGPLKFTVPRASYNARFERDGWFAVDVQGRRCLKWTKPHPRLPIKLNFEPVEKMYTLDDGDPDLLIVEWADFDGRGRLLYAADGRVFARSWNRRGKAEVAELADFCPDRFQSMEAPAWARRW